MKNQEPFKTNITEFLENLVENLPIGMMLIDKEGKILRMNKKQEENSGILRQRVLGKKFQDTYPKTLAQGMLDCYFKLIRENTPFDIIIDKYVPQFYNKKISYHARGAPIISGQYFVLLHGVEPELYRAKRLVEERSRQLGESRNFLLLLIDSSPYILISTDLSGNILIFNKSAQKAFGYSEKEIAGNSIHVLLEDKKLPGKIFKRAPLDLQEIACLRKDSISFPASLSANDVKDITGRTIAKLFLLNDLTEKKKIEDKLSLTEKLATYSELMGGIAHQLNNPLIGVVNFSEMLLKEMKDNDSMKQLAEMISEAGKECLRITQSVLNCFKESELICYKTDVHEVIKESVSALKTTHKNDTQGVKVEMDFFRNIPPIMADEIQLRQCFLNIMVNGAQAMPKGGLMKVKTLYKKSDKKVVIVFEDSGVGIPIQYMTKIFEPFFTLRKSRGRHGLGLNFAYQVIKNHGGDLSVVSEVGEGSAFSVTLPVGSI